MLRPRYIQGEDHKLFMIERGSRTDARGIVIFVPPFAEEMNRCRRMITKQSERLVALGYCCVVPDLSGTGDSFGALQDADLERWRNDLTACRSACELDKRMPVYVIAIRLGAILAASWIIEDQVPLKGLVLWSPVLSGAKYMSQFLRLRSLSAMLSGSGKRETESDLLHELHDRGLLEVAGYTISPRLYRSISEAGLADGLLRLTAPICWLEVAANSAVSPSRPASSTVEKLRNARVDVQFAAVSGDKFWTTVETTTAPAVMDRTESFIELGPC
ncbi:MAG TPA: hydrolase 2, exosortase A system-associated [Woeseiaceae bacterium]|nr:hydrolase 2, exosortase A system-associated [Woeseiaceae bacterium]